MTIAGISKVVEDDNEWKTSTGSVSYYAWKTAGASLGDSQIKWHNETNHDKLFTIEGLSSTTGLSYTGGKVVTVNAEALEKFKASAGEKVTISGGYSFVFGAGVSTPTNFGGESNFAWSLNSDLYTAAYVSGAITDGFVLNGTSTIISYSAMNYGETLTKLSGITDTKDFKVNDKTVTLDGSGFSSAVKILDNSNEYAFNLTGTATGASFTGTSLADTITNAINGLSIYGMSGKDVITNSADNVLIDGGVDNSQ